MSKRLTGGARFWTFALALVMLLSLSVAALAVTPPDVKVSGPLKVTRSQILNGDFMTYTKWNLDTAWSSMYAYDTWKGAGIVSMLSKITINGKNIEPQNGDVNAYDQMHAAMGGGTTSFIQKMNPVAVLSNKLKKIPINMPLNVYGQLKTENSYTAPYTFQTTYKVDYSSYSPLFENKFIVEDDYRQVTFKFAEGETHGRFTGEIKKITLDSYEDTEVPNNVVGVIKGQSMNDTGVGIPTFELDDGWHVQEYVDDNKNSHSANTLLNSKINDNRTYTIRLYREVVVPAIWHPVDKDTKAVIDTLNPKPTYPDMFPRPEVARDYYGTGLYEIDYFGVPKPDSPGSWSGNNMMYTANLWFTDRFHRIVAQAYDTYEITTVSPVVRLTYGTHSAENNDKGLHGMDRTPYQEGETMHLYVMTKTDDVNLSEATFKEGQPSITNADSDDDARATLKDHFKEITYYNIKTYGNELFDVSTFDKLFLFKYADNAVDGSFLADDPSDPGTYVNYMSQSFAGLAPGLYEAVFPLYWSQNIPEIFSAPDTFSRNRYKFDDTVHFTFRVIAVTDVTATKTWDGGPEKDHTKVTINLYRAIEGGTPTLVEGVTPEITPDAKTASAFTYTWKNLPKTDGEGKEYTYTVKEDGVGLGGMIRVNGNDYDVSQTGNDITNTFLPRVKKVGIEKTFVDAPKESDIPAVILTVERKSGTGTWETAQDKDGKDMVYTSAGGSAGPLTHAWEAPLSNKDGAPYAFRVTETFVTDKPENKHWSFANEPFQTAEGSTANVILSCINTYKAPTPIEFKIRSAKQLNGATLVADQFTFVVTLPDGTNEEATNDATGRVQFTDFKVTEPGTYTLTFVEKKGSEPGMSYSTDEYTYTFEIGLHPDSGELIPKPTTPNTLLKNGKPHLGQILFVNDYKKPEPQPEPEPQPDPDPSYPTLSVPLAAKKVFKNGTLKADAFTFELKDGKGKVLAEVGNTANGTIVFPDRTFSREVTNYTYTVSEKAGTDAKIVYDATVYTVKVTTKAVDGKLQATVALEKNGMPYDGDIVFTNQRKSPATGDNAPATIALLLSLTVLAIGGAVIISTKRKGSEG